MVNNKLLRFFVLENNDGFGTFGVPLSELPADVKEDNFIMFKIRLRAILSSVYFVISLTGLSGVVYGNLFGLRGMHDIKQDGTSRWSSGAGNWGFKRLKFDSAIYEIENICRIESNDGGHLFYINEEEVSEELFYLFYNEQSQKEDSEWHTFSIDYYADNPLSDELIREEFSMAWEKWTQHG